VSCRCACSPVRTDDQRHRALPRASGPAAIRDDVSVELRSADDPRPLDQQAFADIEHWIVEFTDQEAGWNAYRSFAALGASRDQIAEKTIVHDAAGRDLLLLIRLRAKP
jgi:hypothetical protein